MKKARLALVSVFSATGIALAPSAAVAGECEIAYASAISSCNGDDVCQWFAYADYDFCIRNQDPPRVDEDFGGLS
ncbi:hypothetical protein HME9302_00817 [Alteripontixanthobacter maritimus]|uniref:Uncharacterized protein n=1 Tax=Alteripontixanthobacter maritimus TaxID=2161824 RepID=A0A369Q8N5_9SPHN|nr:hypothetical protein [Alteripontixanthobacter maritimus]RDC59627.1 hypothetical protein HME9302_00817 [Alteripontixanthobacter maritimus]